MNNDKFTLEDSRVCARIHQIRYENFEKTKHMTPQELIENTRQQAEAGKKCLKPSGVKRKM